MNTTKQHLATKLSSRANIDLPKAQIIIDQVVNVLKEEMLLGNKIELRNFAVFKPYITKPKKGRNIKENEPITIPPQKKVKFILSPRLVKQLNKRVQPVNQ